MGCREMKDKSLLVRIVYNADGEFLPDTSGKAPGRGAYVCRDAGCLQKTQKLKGLERSLKRAIPPNIYMKLTELVAVQSAAPESSEEA